MARVLVKDATTLLSTDIGTVDTKVGIVTIPGEVKTYAGATAPVGFLLCHGQAVSRITYSTLYAVLGNSHGQGDGSTTFNLPDYRGTFLRGRVNINTVSGSGTAASNQATFTGHGINRTGFKVQLSSGTLTGLAISVDYYAIVVDSNTLALATSLANALTNTRITISGTNSAIITQYEDPDTSLRLAPIGGTGGNNIGARQDTRSNNLAQLQYVAYQANTALVSVPENGDWSTYLTLAASGNDVARPFRARNRGGESRPSNSLINYIIKY